MKTESIKLPGHVGYWYVIDEGQVQGTKVFLLEHEAYGDEAACVIIDEYYRILKEDVWNGLSELEELPQVEEQMFDLKDRTLLWGDDNSPLKQLKLKVESLNNKMIGIMSFLLNEFSAELEGMLGKESVDSLREQNQRRITLGDVLFSTLIASQTTVVWYRLKEIKGGNWDGCYKILQEAHCTPKCWFEPPFSTYAAAKNFLEELYPNLIWVNSTLAVRVA